MFLPAPLDADCLLPGLAAACSKSRLANSSDAAPTTAASGVPARSAAGCEPWLFGPPVLRFSGSPVLRFSDAGCALLPSQPHRPAGPDEVRQRRLPLSCPAPRPGTSALLRRRLPPFPHSKKAGQRVVQPLTGAERPSPPVTHTRAVFSQHAAAHKGLIPSLCALRCCVIQSLVCGSDRDRAHGTAAALRTSHTMRGSALGTRDATGRLSEPGSTCSGWDGYAQTIVGVWRWGHVGRYHRIQVKQATAVARVDTRMWYDMGVEDTPLSDGAARSGGRDDRERLIAGVDSSDSMPIETIPSSGAHALSGSGGDAPSDGAHTFLSEDRPDSGIAGDGQGAGPETDNAAVGDPSADAPFVGLPGNGPVDDDLPTDDPVDDLPDDGPTEDGGGMSPVVREYVEGLRREALARDAQLRARGIDPYKGTPVDEGPRRRWGARTLVVLVALVAVVSVGAYVVFFRGEPDYGMSHGYQVQSDGSLKRPPVTDKTPVQPAQMSKGDEAGAAATARYYLNASSYAWNTGDTGPLKSISDEECVFCRDQRSKIEEFYAHGYWATGARSSVTKTQAIEREDSSHEGEVYLVQFRIGERLAEGYTSNGFQESQSRDTVIIFRVGWDGSRWHILEGRAANAEDAK